MFLTKNIITLQKEFINIISFLVFIALTIILAAFCGDVIKKLGALSLKEFVDIYPGIIVKIFILL